MKWLKINGCIEVEDETSAEMVMDKFVDFIEANKWLSCCVIKEDNSDGEL
jgi:hypothetical protein